MTSNNRSGYLPKSSRERSILLQSKGLDQFARSGDGMVPNTHSQVTFDGDPSVAMKGNVVNSSYGQGWNAGVPTQDRRAKALKEIRNSLEKYQRDDSDVDKSMLERCVLLGYDRDVVIETLKANKDKSIYVVLETLNSLTTISGRKGVGSLAPGSLQYASGTPANTSVHNGHPSSSQRSTPTRNMELAAPPNFKPYVVAPQVNRGNTPLYQNSTAVSRAPNFQGGRMPTRLIDSYPDSRIDTLASLEGVRLRQKRHDLKDPHKRLSADVLMNMKALDLGEKRRSLEIPNRPPPPYPGYGQDLITDSPWLLSTGFHSSTNMKRIGSQDTLLQRVHPENLNRTSSPLVGGSNPPVYIAYNGPDVRTQSQVPIISGNLPGPSSVAYQQVQIAQQMKDPPPYQLATSHKALQRTHSPGDKQLLQSKLASRPTAQPYGQANSMKMADAQARCFVPIRSEKFGSVENMNAARMSDGSQRGSPPPYSVSMDTDKRTSLNLEDLEFPPNKRCSVDTAESSIRSDSSASSSPTPDNIERSCSPLPMTSSPHQTMIIHKNGVQEQNLDLEKYKQDCSPFFPRMKSCSPSAFKFYMEQHIENVIKFNEQRKKRRKQLENEMARVGLSDEAQEQMRKMLNQKETNYNRLKRAKMNISLFTKIKRLGIGAFGEVTLVRKTDTNALYAMKTLRKREVCRRNQVAHVKAERDILAEADNEWVVKLYYCFQDEVNLYIVMEYIPGGDLMALLIKFGIFSEELARFYTSELVLALESVHAMGFIHRDIKPDNILIDRTGHIKLTDFGLCTGFRWTHNSKYYQKSTDGNHHRQYSMEPEGGWENHDLPCDCGELKKRFNLRKPLERRAARGHMRCQAHSLVGTPNYIAPEVLQRVPYTLLCDWWSVGVILYEMVVGQPPFFAPSPAETQLKVMNWRTELVIPRNAKISAEAEDLIMKLCTDASERIGAQSTDEIKRHPFFEQVDWLNGPKSTRAPYIPQIRYATDTSNFDPVPENGMPGDLEADREMTEQGLDYPFLEFTFRHFFDDGGHPVPIYDNEPPAQPATNEKSSVLTSNSNKRTANASSSSGSVPPKLAAPPINQGSQSGKMPVYV